MATLTEQFMTALNTAEESGDLSTLLALHADDVTLQNLTEQTWQGAGGAEQFWQRYLSDFEQIHSEFSYHAELDGLGLMEWTSTGQLKGGQAITYRGISVIETQGERVKAFRTYYDSAAFIKPSEAQAAGS